MPYVEDFEEFAARQGCTPLRSRNRYLFPNGAQSDEYNHLEPPSDPTELLRLRHEYATAKLEAVKKRYRKDREAIKQQAYYHRLGAGPMPASGWKEHLQKLVAEIEELQKQAEDLRQQLPTNRLEQDYTDCRNQERQRAAEVTESLQQFPNY